MPDAVRSLRRANGGVGGTLPHTGSSTRALAPIRWIDQTAKFFFFAGFAVAVLAFGVEMVIAVPIATALFGTAFALSHVARVRQRYVTPITLFAVGTAITGIADAIGLSAAAAPERSRYFVYAVDEYLWIAVRLAFAGALLAIIGFQVVARGRAWQSFVDVLPPVRMYFSRRSLMWGGAVLAVLVVVGRTLTRVPELGTLTGMFFLIPSLATFVLARASATPGYSTARYIALGIAILESLRALWFSYLRVEILMPMAAFVFGTIVGARSFRPLRTALFVPVYLFLIAFVSYFGRFGAARAMGGAQRIIVVYGTDDVEFSMQSARRQQTLLSRLTTFNQLSQIGHLVDRDGFRVGETLDYLGYAFIPRFLWPEKPLIAKGAWFALEIGQAYRRPDGTITNSVAMTIPGELYLNFGWPGVLFGCLIYGGMFAVFWTRTCFWEEPNNVFGSAFGFYLLWTAFGLGADLQLIVTTIAMYLVFVGASFARDMIGRQRTRRPLGAGA
jgi:hypothetical protein